MSRSNPTAHLSNPSTRWFEWNGEKGEVRYYDKDKKTNIDVPDFAFVLLDELASVRGWHDPSQSGIYSNEVKDTTQELLVVKSFKGGILAEGKYRDIKDKVNSAGGNYTAVLYIAYKDGNDYRVGALRFKGAALGAWMEFRKPNRQGIYEQAIKITGYTEGQKGRVVLRVPTFDLKPLSAEANDRAKHLDSELQSFLGAYLGKNKREAAEQIAEQPAHHVTDDEIGWPRVVLDDDDDIPF